MVTKAMLGRLSGNPNVLDHVFRGDRFEATYDLWTRGRPLKLSILNDHVRENQVRCTLRVRMCECVISVNFLFVHVMGHLC